jgi:hypothetical protein
VAIKIVVVADIGLGRVVSDQQTVEGSPGMGLARVRS